MQEPLLKEWRLPLGDNYMKKFPSLYFDGIKPFEIHVYYGSSFNSNEKWIVKGFEQIYGMFKTREAAIEKAIDCAKQFLFPQRIYVHSFGSQYMDKYVMTGKTK
jgi:hypothetical protein